MRSSAFKRPSASSPRIAKAELGPSMLKDFGADEKSTIDKLRVASTNKEMNPFSIGNGERPSNMFYKMTNHTTYWWAYNLMDFYAREVSVFSTIKHTPVLEIFRYGLKWVPKFAFKCDDCGFEIENLVTECPICKSKRLRRPDPKQLDYFVGPSGRSILDCANRSGQPLDEVMRQYAESQMQNNEAYTVCITGDLFKTEDGHKVRATPLEFINVDPKFVKLLYDDTGTPGTEYAFTMDDRHRMITLGTTDQFGVVHDLEFYTEQGMELYPAFWKIGQSYGAEGPYNLYLQEEVYHDHWLEGNMTYGRPVWLDMEDDLLTWHYIEKHYLKLTKYGFVRKMIILPGFNDEDVEEITKDIADILAKNDNSIPIICTPPQLPGVSKMEAQTLELGLGNVADYLQIKEEILNRLCAHGHIPNIFMGDVEQSGGMNNESQQITVFDRWLLGQYRLVDRQLAWIQSWYPQITDWTLIVDRPTRLMTDYKKRVDMLPVMAQAKELGHDYIWLNGEVYFSSEPMDQIMRKQQAQMMMQQPMIAPMMGGGGGNMSMPSGGPFPGDGEGPPEAGTARAENPEINDNKNEIEQVQREAEGGGGL